MPYKVVIASGAKNVVVGGKGPFQAGDVVLLTDEQFAAIRPEAFATLFNGTPAAIDTGNQSTGYPYS